MERKIVRQLKKWKTLRDRKPLILHGARQVGKGYSALSFGKKYYKIAVISILMKYKLVEELLPR